MDPDHELRAAAFLALDVLRARLGDDLPVRGGLDGGFAFRGRRVPFLNPQKGIFRAQAQDGPAALSVMTSFRSPYADEPEGAGYWYAYRDGALEIPDNRALRAAHAVQAPMAYFYGASRPGCFQALYPTYAIDRDDVLRRVFLVVGSMPPAGAEFAPPDPITRGYTFREVRARLHQARFRGLVVPAYGERCAVCRLREPRLLDASHIIPDRDPDGEAAVTNGISLCSIHHRAYDEDLVGIGPDHRVHVSRRLLDDDDGPMLDLLKGFHRTAIVVPRLPRRRPDPGRLEERFARFRARE